MLNWNDKIDYNETPKLLLNQSQASAKAEQSAKADPGYSYEVVPSTTVGKYAIVCLDQNGNFNGYL